MHLNCFILVLPNTTQSQTTIWKRGPLDYEGVSPVSHVYNVPLTIDGTYIFKLFYSCIAKYNTKSNHYIKVWACRLRGVSPISHVYIAPFTIGGAHTVGPIYCEGTLYTSCGPHLLWGGRCIHLKQEIIIPRLHYNLSILLLLPYSLRFGTRLDHIVENDNGPI